MPRHKFHHERIYQLVGEPEPGAMVAGYVRYSSEMQDPTTIVTQKRLIQEYAARKGWVIVRWYEEPEQSAKYEEIERRPVFAQLLADAGADFAAVLCYVNNRWARNAGVAFASLNQLRRKRVWWATADELWDIDKVQQDGFDVAFAVDTQMNAAYVRQLSRRVIDAKEDRARAGYHNGQVPFGYLPPEYPKAPDGAPSTWKPPRMPVRRNPATFPALVRIGELAAQGWGDTAIADELENYTSTTPRFGERALTRDTVAAIRRMWFPREFAPDTGHGTIETPSGELIEGQHPAAWPYDLWQRMVEAKASHYHRPQRQSIRRPREFSRIVVCSGCRRPLRIQGYTDAIYYKDTSQMRKLPCPTLGFLSIKSEILTGQFGSLLASVRLPVSWRDAVTRRCRVTALEEENTRLVSLRTELEAEQRRLVTAFAKGYLTESDLDEQIASLRDQLRALPTPRVHDVEALTRSALKSGEAFAGMANYWVEATPEERRDIVWALLAMEGLIYDLERRAIVGLIPRQEVAPILAVGLEAQWQMQENALWLREEHLPPKHVRDAPHQPPVPEFKLGPAQRAQARALIQGGMSLRRVATQFGVSRMAVWRALRAESETERLPDPDITTSNKDQ